MRCSYCGEPLEDGTEVLEAKLGFVGGGSVVNIAAHRACASSWGGPWAFIRRFADTCLDRMEARMEARATAAGPAVATVTEGAGVAAGSAVGPDDPPF